MNPQDPWPRPKGGADDGRRFGPDLDLTQEHCRSLFLSASKFFAAHARLEDAVISETVHNTPEPTALEEGSGYMAESAEVLRAGLSTVHSRRGVIEEVPDGRWQRAYFATQAEGLDTLVALADELAELFAGPGLGEEARQGELQESLWHSGTNHRVRTASIEYLRHFMSLLDHHIGVVEETNR
ncbi:hypothetical protein [Streptomyces sp. NPDC093514]|uniref:hypothetical protein n=1 Tax=Streptomyces sp. NPDC093514 TaxID=3366039 RepID=UPI0038006F78